VTASLPSSPAQTINNTALPAMRSPLLGLLLLLGVLLIGLVLGSQEEEEEAQRDQVCPALSDDPYDFQMPVPFSWYAGEGSPNFYPSSSMTSPNPFIFFLIQPKSQRQVPYRRRR
jgi:hypothetical protein